MSASPQAAGVAGTFYPANAAELAAGVDASLAKAAPPTIAPKAVIAPHAGHIYSGDIAGAAYNLLARRRGEIKRVVLLGPNHRVPVRGMVLSPADAWDTPFGPLPVDRCARDALAKQPGVAVTPTPFSGEHSLEVHLPFIHRALGEVEILPVLVGDSPSDHVSNALEMLWGGPETAIIVSSDLSHFHDYETCKTKDEETAGGIERLQPALCVGDRACGYHAILGLLDQAQRRDLRVTALDVRNSGDTRGPRDRVVGYGSFAFEYAHTAQLDSAMRRTLIDLAREVVKHAALRNGEAPRVNIQSTLPRPLLAQRATFVTLTIGDQLRGCRGSLFPHRSLLLDVTDNAMKSGFGDPRFPPLNAGELERLDVHISILSTPRRIPCQSEADLVGALRPDIDGLIIRDGTRQGLLLPSVWGQIHEPAEFVRQLKLKAGMQADHWSAVFEAYRFGSESFGAQDLPA
jgi:AmmeMemoRadiSam system protein B/AmmeMemoRadiSam system protein A